LSRKMNTTSWQTWYSIKQTRRCRKGSRGVLKGTAVEEVRKNPKKKDHNPYRPSRPTMARKESFLPGGRGEQETSSIRSPSIGATSCKKKSQAKDSTTSGSKRKEKKKKWPSKGGARRALAVKKGTENRLRKPRKMAKASFFGTVRDGRRAKAQEKKLGEWGLEKTVPRLRQPENNCKVMEKTWI